MPDLLVIVGPIGSGKTTVAEGLGLRLRQTGRPVAVLDLDSVVEEIGGFVGLTPERFRQAQEVHGQLVGAWLRQGIDVIGHGPFFDPEEMKAVVGYVPEGTRVRRVLLRCTYQAALERVSADPTRIISRDPGFLRRTYDRAEILLLSLPDFDWNYDTTALDAQEVIRRLASDASGGSQTPSGSANPTSGAGLGRLGSMGTPTLILVTGPGGAGKTTLAHVLGDTIGCRAICRDEIKEGMVDAIGGRYEPAPGDVLTHRATSAFFETLRRLLDTETTVVAEAAFQDHLWRANLEPLTPLARLRIIRCRVDPDTGRQRMAGRPHRTAHADAPVVADAEYYDKFVPISLPVPTIDIDTSDGYKPPLDDIVSFVTRD